MILTILVAVGIWIPTVGLLLCLWVSVPSVRPKLLQHDQPEREVTR